MDYVTMHNGVSMPQIGFGTWQIPSGTIAYESVRFALDAGYRHIDTAAAYYNEESVGKAIADSKIDRSEFFITTKLHNNDHTYELTRSAFEKSLKALGTEYVDLYLIHWPNPVAHRHHWKEANAGSWRAMEEFYDKGLIKAIGISNFAERHIEALLEEASIAPMVNQIRLFAGEQQGDLVSYCQKKGIVLQAYSPLGTGTLLKSELLGSLAQQVGKSSAQVALRYLIQKGFVVLPKSIREATIAENIDVFDFSLDEGQMQALDTMKNIVGPTRNPDETTF
jgi:diketogulonate reductase-like aldo/keto reductase